MQHRHVSAIVTTAGGVEEDLIKCLAPTYHLGSFHGTAGATLRSKGINRIGDLAVPNSNYCAFEDWLMPILDAMAAEQNGTKEVHPDDAVDPEYRHEPRDSDGDGRASWTPSRVIRRLGREIADERSVCYWAWKNDIPIFCPALTDGSLGDMLYFHSFRAESPRTALKVDIVADIRRINTLAVRARRTGMIVLGGGVVKHHIANANLMRNGADAAVLVNTGQEFDGSDAGARPDEAVSWGKIKAGAPSVKVSLVLNFFLTFLLSLSSSSCVEFTDGHRFMPMRRSCSRCWWRRRSQGRRRLRRQRRRRRWKGMVQVQLERLVQVLQNRNHDVGQ